MENLNDGRRPMWVKDSDFDTISTIELMHQARVMRDQQLARYLASAWRGISSVAGRLLHAGHLPKHGQPHAN